MTCCADNIKVTAGTRYMGDKASQKSKWVQLFKNSTDSDSWGQPVEAVEGYERYVPQKKNKKKNLNTTSPSLILSTFYFRLISSLNGELSGSQLSDDERVLTSQSQSQSLHNY